MLEIGLVLAIILVFNLSVLFYKLYKKKYLDLTFDFVILVMLTMVLGGSTLSLIIANLTSFFMSLILYFIPMDRLFPFMGTLREISKPKARLKRRRYA